MHYLCYNGNKEGTFWRIQIELLNQIYIQKGGFYMNQENERIMTEDAISGTTSAEATSIDSIDFTNNTLSDGRQYWNVYVKIPVEVLFGKIATGLPQYPAVLILLGLDCVEKRRFAQKVRERLPEWQYYAITKCEEYHRESEPMVQALSQNPCNTILDLRENAGMYTCTGSFAASQLRYHTEMRMIVGIFCVTKKPTWDDELESANYYEQDMIHGYQQNRAYPPHREDYDYFCDQYMD